MRSWGRRPSVLAISVALHAVACSTSHPRETEIAAISLGDQQFCTLDVLGTVACAVVDRDATPDPAAATMSPLAGEFVALDVGAAHGCAIDREGRAHCWMTDGGCCPGPTFTSPPTVSFSSVSIGEWYGACGVEPSGQVRCWGGDVLPLEAFRDARLVSYGWIDGCIIDASAALHCSDVLGRDHVAPPPGRFIAVESGTYVHCALDEERRAHCWGRVAPRFSSPGELVIAGGPYADFDVGSHFCGVTVEGTIECRHLGGSEGPTTELVVPPGTYRTVSVSDVHACALSTDGEVVCFGPAGE